ncbi:MAG: ATP-binding protein [Clostridia bacterium]|nr:ATP-binding protein [Clostridia bacterium]
MNQLVLLCGKVGCGKTTIATFLKENHNFIHFSADDFMLKLFGEISDQTLFQTNLNKCKELIYGITKNLLSANCNVVLDFGFWTKNEREYVKNLFKNFNVKIVYLKLERDENLKRISNRNSNLKENEYFIDEATFDILSSKFEEPKNEDFIIFKDIKSLEKDLNIL